MSPAVPAPPRAPTPPRPPAHRDHGERQLRRAVSQLEQIAAASARSGKTPERTELERIAIEAAADAREALRVYRDRGVEAAAAEHFYRKLQSWVSELLAHLKAQDLSRTPPAEAPIWATFPVPRSAIASQLADVRDGLVDVTVGELRTAKQWEVALNALCADARYVRDVTLHRSRAAGKAIALFDRIINLMQSLMRTDALDDRVNAGTEAQVGWDDGDEGDPRGF